MACAYSQCSSASGKGGNQNKKLCAKNGKAHEIAGISAMKGGKAAQVEQKGQAGQKRKGAGRQGQAKAEAGHADKKGQQDGKGGGSEQFSQGGAGMGVGKGGQQGGYAPPCGQGAEIGFDFSKGDYFRKKAKAACEVQPDAQCPKSADAAVFAYSVKGFAGFHGTKGVQGIGQAIHMQGAGKPEVEGKGTQGKGQGRREGKKKGQGRNSGHHEPGKGEEGKGAGHFPVARGKGGRKPGKKAEGQKQAAGGLAQ